MRKRHLPIGIALVVAAFLLPGAAGATLVTPDPAAAMAVPDLPPALSSYSRTATLEWGCPVSDQVTAASQDEAVSKIRSECMDEVSRAAARKPGVMNVLDTRVVYPDIEVHVVENGFRLEGTFFLETVVLQRSTPGSR